MIYDLKLGGKMRLEDKIYGSIGLTVFLTIAYYYVYSFVDLYMSKLCKKYVCFEFPPYADVLAIWVAIIGLYFVVTSLDDWKNQDKYQTAKKNIELLHTLSQKLELYNSEISNLENRIDDLRVYFKMHEKSVEHTRFYKTYESWLNKFKIKEEIQNIDYCITQQAKCLYQVEFNSLISLAHRYINTIDAEIGKIDIKIVEEQNKNIKIIRKEHEKITENLTDAESREKETNSYLEKLNKEIKNLQQGDIDRIVTREHNTYLRFKKELKELQGKLNKY